MVICGQGQARPFLHRISPTGLVHLTPLPASVSPVCVKAEKCLMRWLSADSWAHPAHCLVCAWGPPVPLGSHLLPLPWAMSAVSHRDAIVAELDREMSRAWM